MAWERVFSMWALFHCVHDKYLYTQIYIPADSRGLGTSLTPLDVAAFHIQPTRKK